MKQLNWYQIFGQTHTIPDGRTVTPTDDIQIWLNCANIWDKTYTTLAEVLADTTTLLALINSPNAVDYMVRSTTWAVSVASVPTMTDNTHPYGECFATAIHPSNGPYHAFDGDNSTVGVMYNTDISASVPSWIGYMFESPVSIEKAYIYQNSYTYNNCYIQSSTDGVTYENASSVFTLGKTAQEVTFNAKVGKYFRLYVGSVQEGTATARPIRVIQFYSASITDNATAMSCIGLNNYCANTLLADSTWCNAICNSEYFESVLNAKVPVMTSDTEPEGQAIASSEYMPAKNAFDGNAASMWNAVNTPSNGWVGYTFVNECAVVKTTVYPFASSGLTPSRQRATTYYIQGSNDGANWTDLDSFSGTASVQEYTRIFANANKYISYRVLLAAQNYTTNEMLMATLQFYGRKDV